MKPITVKMTAFGPYKETELIDFTELGNHRLFVVSGATGAGKTTIFDAICFALYGQASGEDRTEVRTLRSDFADDAVQSEVELVFQVKGHTFRIMRQIPYTKAGNKTETAARCEFFERTLAGEVPFVDRQIVSEINRKVEELIGFTHAQFSQIVMLPQGEFRKFLTSDTENKETILRKIFRTEPYRELIERLKAKRMELHASWENERASFDRFIRQIPEAVPVRESDLFTIVQAEHPNLERLLTAMGEEELFYLDCSEEAKSRYELAYSEHAKKQAAYAEAKAVNDRFAELEAKKATLLQLEEKRPLMAMDEKRLQDAERAASIRETERHYQEQAADAAGKQAAYNRSAEALVQAKRQFDEASKGLAMMEERKPEKENLERLHRELESYVPAVLEIEQRKAEINRLTKVLADSKDKLDKVIQQEAAKSEDALHRQAKIYQMDKELLSFEEQVDSLHKVNLICSTLEDAERMKQEAVRMRQEVEHSREQAEAKAGSFRALEREWIENQAAVLASTLHPGDSCPVCGSTDHPVLAEHTNAAVTKEQLEDARRKKEEAADRHRSLHAKAESAGEYLAEVERKIEEMQIDRPLTELKAEQARLKESIGRLRSLREQMPELKSAARKIADELEALRSQQDAMKQDMLKHESAMGKEEALCGQLMEKVPETYRDQSHLAGTIRSTERKKNDLENQFAVIQKRFEETKELLTKAESAEQFTKQSMQESMTRKDDARLRFDEALRDSEFLAEEEFRAAYMEPEKRKALRESIDGYKQDIAIVNEMIKSLSGQLEGKAKTVLEELAGRIQELKKDYEEALSHSHAAETRGEKLKELKRKIEKSSGDIGKMERELVKVTDLYDILRGQNGKKLSYERFIQIDYLERIIASANVRLRELSAGQFELMRSGRQEARGRQSGLGLDIYDAYTGQNRDVKTLSGGEKFNASLSLALGMADVIQSFQGSVSIETMFIDEGFGSLDTESLHKAIDTLIDLQRSGRLIGVISHVEELKASFPAILEVTKLKEGHSQAAFRII